MVTCPKCGTIYRKDAPNSCVFCGTDLTIEKEKESKEEQKDKQLEGVKCSKCGSTNLKLSFERNLHTGYIKCEDCGNFDTREFVDGKAGDLVKCDLCGSTTTEIQSINGFAVPLWTYTEFEYIDNKILCKKCFEERMEELEEKEEEIKNKKPVIMYIFDGDELKYWRKGDVNDLLGKIDINNDNGKQRYKKALKEMKSKFPKRTKFVDIDE